MTALKYRKNPDAFENELSKNLTMDVICYWEFEQAIDDSGHNAESATRNALGVLNCKTTGEFFDIAATIEKDNTIGDAWLRIRIGEEGSRSRLSAFIQRSLGANE